MASDGGNAGDAGRLRLPGRWFRLRFTAPRAAEDEIIGLLQLAGSSGLSTAPGGPRRLGFEAWFDDAHGADAACRSVGALDDVRMKQPAVDAIEDPGWLEASRRRRGALVAGGFVVLDDPAAVIEARGSNALVPLLLPPGRAFGTGEHATTRMCLELLEGRLRPGGSVLDLGTGSAILAIATVKAGAGPVLALDNDPNVIEVADENIALNGCAGSIELGVGSWQQIAKERRFDLLLANIHRTALVRGAGPLAAHLAPRASAILSGFHPEDVDAVRAAWERAGCVLTEDRVDGEWAALALRRDA